MKVQLFSNNATSAIIHLLAETDTVMYIQEPHADRFTMPTSGAFEYELLLLTNGIDWEVVKATARNVNALTIERAYEGTAREWPAGTVVKATATARTMSNFLQQDVHGSAINLFNFSHFF